MNIFLYYLFFYRFRDPRELHVLTPSFPTRRSSDLAETEQFDQISCSYVCYQQRRGTCGAWDAYYGSHLAAVSSTSGATRYPPAALVEVCSSVHEIGRAHV